VFAHLEALVAQLEVAGRVVDITAAEKLRARYRASLPKFPGARAFVAYVDAEEAVAAPELVAAFARAFDAGSDATLVLGGDGWSEERFADEIGPVAGALGADAPDLLAVTTVPRDLGDLIHVVLSERAPRVTGVPHVGANGDAVLRELAAGVAS
jgi:hypothetical protein